MIGQMGPRLAGSRGAGFEDFQGFCLKNGFLNFLFGQICPPNFSSTVTPEKWTSLMCTCRFGIGYWWGPPSGYPKYQYKFYGFGLGVDGVYIGSADQIFLFFHFSKAKKRSLVFKFYFEENQGLILYFFFYYLFPFLVEVSNPVSSSLKEQLRQYVQMKFF